MAVAANETYTQVSNQRRNAFDAKLMDRTASPLEAAFWTGLVASVEPDTARVRALAVDAWRTILAAAEPGAALAAIASLAIAVGLGWPLRRLLLRLVRRRRIATSGPREGLRRSAHALAVVLINTASPAAAAVGVNLGLTWGRAPVRQGRGAHPGAGDRGGLGRGRSRPSRDSWRGRASTARDW